MKKLKKTFNRTVHVPWSTGDLILRRMYLGGKGVIPCAKRAALVLRSSGSGAALTESAVARVARTEMTVVNFIVTKDKGVKRFLDISFQKVDMFYIWARWGYECATAFPLVHMYPWLSLVGIMLIQTIPGAPQSLISHDKLSRERTDNSCGYQYRYRNNYWQYTILVQHKN